ncbi:hypothetical protein HZS_1516, partial [Henneguya salminicola]
MSHLDNYCGGKENLTGCILLSTVSFNNIQDSRNIILKEEYDEMDGIFLFHSIIWNESKDEDKVTTNLKIILIIEKNNKSNTIYNNKYTILIKAASNSETNIDVNLSKNEKFGIYAHYRCLGWIGYNCQFPCDTDTYDIECNFETGTVFCKNPTYTNPPKCKSSIFYCSTYLVNSNCGIAEKAMFQNNGSCAKTFPNTFQCLCPSGYGGQYCQNYNCEPPCDVDFGECVGPNKCKCSVDFKHGPSCNITKCDKITCQNEGCHILSFYRCMQIRVIQGSIANFPAPIFAFMDFAPGEAFCDCFDGYEGENC